MCIEYKEGFPFGFDSSWCKICGGKCCRGERGYVWVGKEDIERLLVHLNLNFEDMAQSYLRKLNYRFSLREKVLASGEFACIFFDEESGSCKLYEARPRQCREFPFWERYRKIDNLGELLDECPGVKVLEDNC